MGIQIYSQKSGVKSEELVVERSLKVDALNLNWLGVIDEPSLHGQFKNRIPLSLVLLQWKKNCETNGCVLSLLNLVSLLSVQKELGWGREISLAYYYRKLRNQYTDFWGRIKFGSLEVEMILKLQFA